jgi:hypothetical protein
VLHGDDPMARRCVTDFIRADKSATGLLSAEGASYALESPLLSRLGQTLLGTLG